MEDEFLENWAKPLGKYILPLPDNELTMSVW